jgi:hypothetical protein
LLKQERPTVPDREALKALYDEAVNEINAIRCGRLTTEFYAKTGDAVFNAGYLALSDHLTNTRRMHTVSAPAGGGKTSFSYALIAAVTRHAENRLDAPYGCVFVVDQITKADEVYRDLNALLPGKVAIWTTDHDIDCKKPERIEKPAAQFSREQLRHFPVVVVTHKFYLGTKGRNARAIVRDGRFSHRALTVVDERPEEVETFDILLSEAQHAREELIEAHPETKEHLDVLFRFMEPYSYEPANRLYRPGVDLDRARVAEQLWWFNTEVATRLANSSNTIAGADRLFAFAKAMVGGFGYVVTGAQLVRFVAYKSKLTINLSAGTILLDATADIDGVSHVVPWRVQAEMPKARYDNLEIVHVRQHTKTRLREYLKKAPNQRAYVKWMVKTIKEHMAPGERGLVICKKVLFDAERVPQWPDGDVRFKDPESYTKRYEWDIDGRKLCATHWGTGIGSNDWKDADVVLLFDEFIIPRRVAVATLQGLREHKANQGDLASMKTLRSKAPGVDCIAEGHRLRWTKQLALRGRGRSYDAHGVCGKQRLVVGSELKSFMANASRLFPGANIRMAGDCTEDATWIDRVIAYLSKPGLSTITTTKDIGDHLGKPWRTVSGDVLTPEFTRAVGALGWRYMPGRGRSGSRFERTPLVLSQAA